MTNMKITIIIFTISLIFFNSGIAQINGHLEIGTFCEFWPFKNHMVENPISPFHGGIEISAGISVFPKHIIELGITTGISAFNSKEYSEPLASNLPVVTKTRDMVVFVRGQLMFFPVSLFDRFQEIHRIDPYVITEFGPDIEYFSKTVTTDYPKYQSDSIHELRSPSINTGFGIGARIFLTALRDNPKVALDFRVLYMFSGQTHYATLDQSLGYFPVNEGKKEFLFFNLSVSIINVLQ